MTRYSELYHQEKDKLRRVETLLAQANSFVSTFSEFLTARNLRGEYLEFLLTKHLGASDAARILAEIEKEKSHGTPAGQQQ